MSAQAEDADLAFAAAQEAEGEEALVVSLAAFEGPLHLLLELARAKKLDLARVSISDIADQYLAFIAVAQARDIELAGDYLVMAAWLALIKTRALLPRPQLAPDEPDPDAMAEALREKLARLDAARAAARRLDAMAQLGRDIFTFGAPKPIARTTVIKWRADLYDLLAAYCAERAKQARKRAYKTMTRKAFPLEAARRRLEESLPSLAEWASLAALAPAPETGPEAPPPSSYVASTLCAALELTREGKTELRQTRAFEPLFLRARAPDGAGP